jgi:hypothetical protein
VTSNSCMSPPGPRCEISDSVRDPHAARLCDLLPNGVVKLEIRQNRVRRGRRDRIGKKIKEQYFSRFIHHSVSSDRMSSAASRTRVSG